MKKFLQLTSLLSLLLIPSLNANAQGWTSDPVHSSMAFQIRHIVTPLIGRFDKFEVALKWDEKNLDASSISASVDVTSVNTGFDGRDKHIKSADFFDAENHPTWNFTSEKIVKNGDEGFIAKGKITLRETTMDIEIPFKFLGVMELEKGNKAGFSAEFSIKRSDYALGGDMGGGVGDEVKIMVFLEMNGK
jgi:polyisoprenoid-binding protein YceI